MDTRVLEDLKWIETTIWKLIPCSSYYAKKETGFKTYHTCQLAEIALAEGLSAQRDQGRNAASLYRGWLI